MFEKILVALNTEESCSTLFKQALTLAQSTGAELRLLSVMSPHSYYPMPSGYFMGNGVSDLSLANTTFWETYQQEYQAHKEKGLAILSQFAKQAIAAGVQVEMMQAIGDPGQVICDRARAENVSLVIVGSHGRRGLDEFLVGSVSSYVMHRAPCSVLITKDACAPQLSKAPLTTAEVTSVV